MEETFRELPRYEGGGSPHSTGAIGEPAQDVLAGGGEMGALMRSIDWASTPLGPVSTWSQALRTTVGLLLRNRFPLLLWWGPEFVQLYNDAYQPIPGAKHPASMGQPARECWAEIWHIIGPLIEGPFRGEPATWSDDLELFILRRGFLEETHYKVAYSPVPDGTAKPTGIGGVLATVAEITEQVYGHRQLCTLRELGARAADAKTPEEACETAAATLGGNARDVPFALLYLLDETGQRARLAGAHGLGSDEHSLAPLIIDLRADSSRTPWPLERVVQERQIEILTNFRAPLGQLPKSERGSPVRMALALPLASPDQPRPYGFLVVGVSPHRALGESYRSFFELAAAQVVTAIRNARERVMLLGREFEARREADLQKEHLYSLFSQAPVPMLILRGPELVLELANEPVCRVWGRRHEDVINRPLFQALPELRGQSFEGLLQNVLATGETYIGREVLTRLDRRQGGSLEDVYLNFVYAPLKDTRGAVEGVLVVAFDVTDEVIARQQMSRLRIEAERANRAKDEFLAILGHELRNPLAPILTALQLMRLRGEDSAQKERTVLERQAQHLVRLVDDLLDVSRITRGMVDLKKQRVELAEVVARAIEMASPLLEERQHQLVVEVALRGLAVNADPERMAQVISNLLTNAAKYTEPNGRITVAAAAASGLITLRVRDTGIGIAREMLPKVFDMFVQERQALDRSQGGLGLGLTIVKTLVTLHGGSVEVNSEGRGRGAEFIIRLPQAAEEAGQGFDPASSRPLRADRQPCRVLVVDDNRDAAEMLCETLDLMGYTVRVAYRGPEALQLALEFQPDIALLDIGLPVMDGYEVARRLHDYENLREMRLVAITGYGQDADRDRSRAAGFHAHVVKPLDLDKFESLMKKLTAEIGLRH